MKGCKVLARLLLVQVIVLMGACVSYNTERSLRLSDALEPKPDRDDTYTVGSVLRNNYCKELFLRYGYDMTAKSYRPTHLDAAYKDCKESVAPSSYPSDKFGLALSGGGTRSASYSMGVLGALQQSGMLQEFDSVSSVSGGGYTAFWYFFHRYYQFLPRPREGGNSDRHYYQKLSQNDAEYRRFCSRVLEDTSNYSMDEIFALHERGNVLEDIPFQRQVERQSDIVNYSTSKAGQYAETTGLVTSHVATLPVYWVTDLLLNTGLFNGSVFTNAYRKGLERTYGLVVNKEHNSYADYFYQEPEQYVNGRNGSFLFWRDNSRIDEIHFRDFRKFAEFHNRCLYEHARQTDREHIPVSLPIINTKLTRPATFWPSDKHADVRSLEKSVYTFTPLAYGSSYTGHFNDAFLATPTYMSKAYAISGAAADSGAPQVSTATKATLVTFNANLGYKVRNPSTQDGVPGSIQYYVGKLIGGFPLGLAIPESAKTTVRLSDGGHAENLGLYSLIARGTRRIVAVDAEHDPDYAFDSLNRLRVKLELELGLELVCAEEDEALCPSAYRFKYNKAAPTFKLKVKGFVGADGQTQDIDILYIKLSILKKHLPKESGTRSAAAGLPERCDATCLPDNVIAYYQKEADDGRNAFPQNSTADIWYSEEQYRAYRDLGHFNTMHYLNPLLEEWRSDLASDRAAERKFFEALQ